MSNTDESDDIANKNMDEETNLQKSTSKEDNDSTKCLNTKPANESSMVPKKTGILETETAEEKFDIADANSDKELTMDSENDILQQIDDLIHDSYGDANKDGNLSISANLSEGEEKNDNDSPDKVIKNDKPLEDPEKDQVSDTDNIMKSPSKMVHGDETDVQEPINIDTIENDNQIIETSTEKATSEYPADTGTEKSVSDNEIAKADKDIQDSVDNFSKIDDVNPATTEVIESISYYGSLSQKSDSNEEMLLRWEDSDEQLESNNKDQVVNDETEGNTFNSPMLKQTTEEKNADDMDVLNEGTVNEEESKQLEVNHPISDVIEKNTDNQLSDHNLDENLIEKPKDIQTDTTSPMDISITETSNENLESFPETSTPLKVTKENETKMDLDRSIIQDDSLANNSVDAENEDLARQPKSPVKEKVDVHNPETSVKEYSIDLSVVTGEVNGPERNKDCHDLLQIQGKSHEITSDDSVPAINREHGLNKPDIMLEIPTQELIDFDDSNIDDNETSFDETVDCKAEITEHDTAETNIISDNQVKLKDDSQNQKEESANNSSAADSNEEDEIIEMDSTLTVTNAKVQKANKDIPLDSKQNAESEFGDAKEENAKSITNISNYQTIFDQPSTSTATLTVEMTPDTSDDVPETTDSLGLLAESTRVVDEEEDNDDDNDSEDIYMFDVENVYPVDDSSSQNTGDNSDSSPVNDESDVTHTDTDVPPDESDTHSFEPDMPQFESERQSKGIETPLAEDIAFNFQLSKSIEAGDGGGDEKVDKVNEKPKDKTKDVSMEMDTVKLSDTSDNEDDTENKSKKQASVLRNLLLSPDEQNEDTSEPQSKELENDQQKNSENIVNLEGSSDDDDREQEPAAETEEMPTETVISVNIPGSEEVMFTLTCPAGSISKMQDKGGEGGISGVPKPPPPKIARLNTSEVSKASTSSWPLIPEQTSDAIPTLEVFDIDSDDNIEIDENIPPSFKSSDRKRGRKKAKCINSFCQSDSSIRLIPARATDISFFNYNKKRRPKICLNCAHICAARSQELIVDVRELIPLMDIDPRVKSEDLVEISDSESDDNCDDVEIQINLIGKQGANFINENLLNTFNETWVTFKLDERMRATDEALAEQLRCLKSKSEKIDEMLKDCQRATDNIRNELYSMFQREILELPPLIIDDTEILPEEQAAGSNDRQNKRRLSGGETASAAKRPAIPLGYAPLSTEATASQNLPDTLNLPDVKIEDDRDISVVQLSAEAAPADLPAPGELIRPSVRPGMQVYAMRNAFGSWLRGKVQECLPKGTNVNQPFTMCRVRFEHKVKNPCKVLPARCLAYAEPAEVRMTIATRVIALCRDSTNTGKRDSFYSGVIAEIPNPVNNYRYLVFFDDGYAQYVKHSDTRLVVECSAVVWEEVHPFSRDFVREYLMAYPERPMVRLHPGQSLKTEWNGKWWVSRVVKVDASLVQVQFDKDNRMEWIYRGSTRLAPLYLEFQAAERTRTRPLPRSKTQTQTDVPYVEYTRTNEQGESNTPEMEAQEQKKTEELRHQRAVAKKSTTSTPLVAQQAPFSVNLDFSTSRVVYYTPKSAVKPRKMVAHTCGPRCRRADVLALNDLRTYNPLTKPLLSGWERQLVRYKGNKQVLYRAPCGRRVRCERELHAYLRAARLDMPVDLFDFSPSTHCLAEFVLSKCIVGKKDLSHGKENVPVPCVNYYDESLPEFCSYNTERTPTTGVPLNLDPEFLCGCDCTDDCADKTKCACWKLTLEGARTIGLKGLDVGYSYKRLREPLPSGIYECNSRCKCKHTCLNRVAQHPLQLKLQVFKTMNRGWGIRTLNDVPKGAFLCVYAGNLLTDATANLDGLNEGDEYLAELDYIEVVEQMKEGYEADIPEADKKFVKMDIKTDGKSSEAEESEDMSTDDDEEKPDKNDVLDDDFTPGYIGPGITEFNKHLRKRGKIKEEENEEEKDIKDNKIKEEKVPKYSGEECITISDDEEVRKPSRFTAQAGMAANEYVSKYKSVRAHFGKDEACYIMDAKVQGNIGRYLNHSCSPNVFVQNVFVDTHDPRFPWVAFFALSHIKAGTELTWNYNYDIGSVPEKLLYCYCGAPNCRRRLL